MTEHHLTDYVDDAPTSKDDGTVTSTIPPEVIGPYAGDHVGKTDSNSLRRDVIEYVRDVSDDDPRTVPATGHRGVVPPYATGIDASPLR